MAKKSKAEQQKTLAKGADNEGAVDMPDENKKLPVEEGEVEGKAAKKEKVVKVKEEKAPGLIQQILSHHKDGKSNKEIQELDFHPTTISIQVSKYKKFARLLFGKTDAEISAKGYDPTYVHALEKADKAVEEKKVADKATADKAKADKAAEKKAAAAAVAETATV